MLNLTTCLIYNLLNHMLLILGNISTPLGIRNGCSNLKVGILIGC